MKNKVITLEDGFEYIVVDEIILDRRIYLFAFRANDEKEEIYNNYTICEVRFENDGVSLSDIESDKVYDEVSDIFLKRLQESKKEGLFVK